MQRGSWLNAGHHQEASLQMPLQHVPLVSCARSLTMVETQYRADQLHIATSASL
jgi:hypothetical protein